MPIKLLTGLIGLGLFVAFLLPPMIKLGLPALMAVAGIGIAMAAYEFYEYLRSKYD